MVQEEQDKRNTYPRLGVLTQERKMKMVTKNPQTGNGSTSKINDYVLQIPKRRQESEKSKPKRNVTCGIQPNSKLENQVPIDNGKNNVRLRHTQEVLKETTKKKAIKR